MASIPQQANWRSMCAALAVFTTTIGPAKSAEVQLGASAFGFPVVSLLGEVVQGDYEEFRRVLMDAVQIAGGQRLVIALDSPGGNISESMKISYAIREILAETWTMSAQVFPPVPDPHADIFSPMRKTLFIEPSGELPRLPQCWSACTLILLGGVERRVWDNQDSRSNDLNTRIVMPTVGVHRPTFADASLGNLDSVQAQIAYASMLEEVSEFMSLMGASQGFIELMRSTDRSDLALISSAETQRYFEYVEPFFVEWISSKCGTPNDYLTERESRLYTRLIGVYSRFDVDEARFSYEDWQDYLDILIVQEFGIKDAAEAMEVAEAVVARTDDIEACSVAEIQKAREKWMSEN